MAKLVRNSVENRKGITSRAQIRMLKWWRKVAQSSVQTRMVAQSPAQARMAKVVRSPVRKRKIAKNLLQRRATKSLRSSAQKMIRKPSLRAVQQKKMERLAKVAAREAKVAGSGV